MSWYGSIIVIALVIYAVLLYGSSIYGFIRSSPLTSNSRKLLYSLSFTSYGSAWMFLGIAEKTKQPLWDILPLFLGPILVFIFFYRTFSKILNISQQENVTSIPDFIAKRYGNSRLLASMVSLLCLMAFIPYIALQIKALIDIINIVFQQSSSYSIQGEIYLTLIILLSLGLLIVIIGGRQASIVEYQYKSLLYSSALGAILKLIAFVGIGLLACSLLYERTNYQTQPINLVLLYNLLDQKLNVPDFIVQTILMMTATVCLPHLFQTGATKVQKSQDLNTARWLLPFYFLIMMACLLPLIMVGQLMGPEIGNNYWLITLPIHQSSTLLTLLVLIGAFAAITGTAITCCFALSRMVTNHILINSQSPILSNVSFSQLQALRWLSIIFILALAMGCYLCISKDSSLNSIGLIAFAGIAQLAPAMTGALYWKLANRLGASIGLIVGTSIWLITLLCPLLLQDPLNSFSTVPFLTWLKQTIPVKLSYINFCIALSLIANFGCFIAISLLSKKRVTEHWQATKFISQDSNISNNNSIFVVKLEDLISLASRFLGEKKTLELFRDFAKKREITLDLSSKADQQWIFYTEHLLAESLGTSTARAMVKSAIEGREMQMEDVFLIVDEASEVLHFNRMLLQGALEHITQGISVIDKSLHLVAWNKRYVDLFDYPEGFIHVGRPIADIIYYNAKRGMCGLGNPEEHVIKRLSWLSLGQPHTSERLFPNGRFIEMIGNPMAGGGFVTSFTDITAYRQAEQALQEVNESLEQRVAERTRKLLELNTALIDAKSYAEQANASKTRFLAAVSHDLMQPLNAARLFSASLSQEHLPSSAKELVNHLESSLHSAEELISDLLDMSRLESGRITPKIKVVALVDLFDTLNTELSALVPKDIQFKVHYCSLFVRTDGKLLRRILQNFLTNAFRYGQGKVVLGTRRLKGHVRIEVWDQGPGIPEDKQKAIFEEFKRLDSHQTRAETGLGLGLAIADGFCKLLDHPIAVRSWLGKGSVFSVTVPIEESPLMLDTKQIEAILDNPTEIVMDIDSAISVLCVDNEESILIGMDTLLSRWGCNVATALNQEECAEILAQGLKPQLLLIDYHLDAGQTGIELIDWLREQLQDPTLPAIIISADNNPEVAEKLQAAKLEQVKKPIKPAQLRALISRYINLN